MIKKKTVKVVCFLKNVCVTKKKFKNYLKIINILFIHENNLIKKKKLEEKIVTIVLVNNLQTVYYNLKLNFFLNIYIY